MEWVCAEIMPRRTGIYASVDDLKGRRFDLQLFAAEDEGRTEEPTDRKIQEARRKGQVVKTMELPQALVVLAGFLLVFTLGGWMYDRIARMTVYYMKTFPTFTLTDKNFLQEFYRMIDVTAMVLLPLFAVCLIAGIVGNVVQVGFEVTTHPLQFDLTKIKISPAEMMRKMFFSRQVAMNLLKSILKVVIIGFCSYLIIANDFDLVIKSPDISIGAAVSAVGVITLKIIVWSCILLLVLSVPDYFVQRAEFMESLKMSKQEMKDEMKESYGDPHMRGRMREVQRDILTRNMLREVPKADVIVTNPTHYAIALQWDRLTMNAPSVISKGVDELALRIRNIAREHDILMVENRPLAHELYDNVEIGQQIPPELFAAVVEVYQMLVKSGKLAI